MPATDDGSPLKVLIVDDEEPARKLLTEYLSAEPDVEVVGECGNGFDAVKVLSEHPVDLLFLDIQMPKLTGFEVLELIDPPPAIIFATAYDQYALKAFEVHAVDYLLKPFSRERFAEALAQARERIRRREPLPAKQIAADVRDANAPLERILVKEGARVHVIPADAVDYIEAQDDYIAVKAEGKSHLKQQRMADVEKLLDAQQFIRVHRSYIVNVDRIARIELYAKDSRVAILKDGTRLPISRTGYEKLKGKL